MDLNKVAQAYFTTRSEKALDTLVNECRSWAVGFALKNSYSQEEAQDFAGDVALKLLRNLPTYKGGCRFFSWFYAIAASHLKDRWRRKVKRPLTYGEVQAASGEMLPFDTFVGELVDNSQQTPEQALLSQEILAAYETALDSINPEQAAAVRLFAAGASEKQIAAKLGCGIGTVKSRLSRGRKHLLEALA